jgi:hypothetical protein
VFFSSLKKRVTNKFNGYILICFLRKKFLKNNVAKTIFIYEERRRKETQTETKCSTNNRYPLSLFPYIASNDSLPLMHREEKKRNIQFYVESNDARTIPMVEKVIKTV